MQPPPDGSYPGSQGSQGQGGDQGQGGEQGRPGYPQQGGQYPGGQYPGDYSYPQQGPPQQPSQQGYPGNYFPGPGYVTGIYGSPPPPPPRGVASRGWFWITLAAVVVIVAAVIGTLVATSGGGGTPVGQGSDTPTSSGTTSSTESTSAPETSTSAPETSTSAPETSTSAPETSTSSSATARTSGTTSGGQIGRTYDVNGQSSGEKLAVTLIAVDQKARATDAYNKPPAGDHFVATEYRIRSIGSARYDDAVDNCVMVYDDQKSKYAITIVQSISSGNVIDEVGLAPGQSIQGWLVYALPKGKTISSATFTPNSGIADTTLTWKTG